MCGKTLKDEVRSKYIQEITGVENITEVTGSQRLRWYRHVERLSKDEAFIMARNILICGKDVGRLKKRLK